MYATVMSKWENNAIFLSWNNSFLLFCIIVENSECEQTIFLHQNVIFESLIISVNI